MNPNSHQPRVAAACERGEARVSIYDEITSHFLRQMAEGRAPWDCHQAIPHSAASGKPFSAINILILWDAATAHGFVSPHWLTFRQAIALGGSVRKDQTGTTACYADSFIPKAARERAASTGADPARVPCYKRFHLFNVAQCEKLPAARAITPPGWPSNGPHTQSHASYAGYFLELARGTLNPDSLKRFGKNADVRRDLIAELASAFLCAQFGIASRLEQPRRLTAWGELLSQDSRALFHAASQASKTADSIIASFAQQAGRAA